MQGYDSPRCFPLAGQGGVGIPPSASGVLLNVTAVGHTADGWVTLYPAGEAVPDISTLNVDPDAYAVANTAVVRVGRNGEVCAVGAPGMQVILDVVGYLADPAAVPLLANPRRLVDTRGTSGGGSELLAPGTPRCFAATGRDGIPANATGVLLNVTAVGQTGDGWLTLYPAGQAVPDTSTLNFDADLYTVVNFALARVGANGQVCVSAGGAAAHLILDAVGYVVDASVLPLLASPQRLVDTRPGFGLQGAGEPLRGYRAEDARCFTVAGLAGIPSSASGVLLNLTVVGHPTDGWLTVYPAGQGVPSTSNLNFATAEYAIANAALVRVGANGQVCATGAAGTNLILDAVGYVN